MLDQRRTLGRAGVAAALVILIPPPRALSHIHTACPSSHTLTPAGHSHSLVRRERSGHSSQPGAPAGPPAPR